MINAKNKAGHPLFISSVLTLIVNDWILKPTFHNVLTGKLSDFAGLFAFPFLFGLLFPKQIRNIHLFAAILFLFWKSIYARPIILFFNHLNIPINRTIDFTDNIALISILFSFMAIKHNSTFNLRPLLQNVIIVISCFAFMATTMSPRDQRKFVNIDKEYEFNFSKRELVSRLNMVQIKEIRQINKYSGQVDFNSETNVFHYAGSKDTLALLLDYQKIKDKDTISIKTSFAEMLIIDNGLNSILKLLTVYKFIPKFSDKDYKEKAIEQFEKRIIKKIKNYR